MTCSIKQKRPSVFSPVACNTVGEPTAPLPDPAATGGIVERVEEFPAATRINR